ncbi:MAG: ADP-ribosylglycohydrolase family protein [Prevotellaceae bacterium]|nr:ADP-ribosylglycohydrolase family protein [Prevotellaceae bacterium]
MKNLLMSAVIGDIAGSAYEGRTHRTKDYNAVKMFSSRAHFTDDTVLTFACAEAFLKKIDMSHNIWMCANQHPKAGYGHRFKEWMQDHDHLPYSSFGNGAAMRASSAGWIAQTEEECVQLATETALPTHNHEEGIRGAVVTALAIFHLKNGKDKKYIEKELLNKHYPYWAGKTYDEIHDDFIFNSTSPGTVGPAIICFIASTDYTDCIKLAISLGGDADTLAAIAGPMAYAYYKEMPEPLVYKALKTLPDWMQRVNMEFDEWCNKLNLQFQDKNMIL